jgi:putative tricarboxylic transport membrane protein
MEANRRRNEKITAVFLLGFSVLFFFKGLGLPLGTFQSPGPGFLPAVVGGLLILCGAAYFLRVFRKKEGPEGREISPEEGRKNYWAVGGIFLCALLFPLLLEPLNFLLTTFAVSFLMLLALQPKKWGRALVLAFFLSAGSFLIFARLLGVSLPMGALEVFLFRLGG